MHHHACVVAANQKKPSAWIQALSCRNSLRYLPFGLDLGPILPEPTPAPTLRPGYRPHPARTRAGGGPDEPSKLVRILRQPPLSVLSGGGAPTSTNLLSPGSETGPAVSRRAGLSAAVSRPLARSVMVKGLNISVYASRFFALCGDMIEHDMPCGRLTLLSYLIDQPYTQSFNHTPDHTSLTPHPHMGVMSKHLTLNVL